MIKIIEKTCNPCNDYINLGQGVELNYCITPWGEKWSWIQEAGESPTCATLKESQEWVKTEYAPFAEKIFPDWETGRNWEGGTLSSIVYVDVDKTNDDGEAEIVFEDETCYGWS
jgi:hypothetical protein